jgi:hypothetical protein
MSGSLYGQATTSTLSGMVHDEKGSIIPGANITIKSVATGTTKTSVSDSDGRYSFSNLSPDTYEVRVERSGFKTYVQPTLKLSVADTLTLDITMVVGEVTEQVVVSVGEQLVEQSKTEISRVIDPVQIESLPNIGRNFVDFVKLSSGVSVGRENVGGGPFKEPDTGVGVAAAPRLSFGGQTELNTMIQVDGVDNTQTFTGLPRATPSQEAAREFRVLNSTYLAEYGRALGGFVNIVTKSGTNNYRGSLYYYGMNDELNARAILDPPNAVLRQNQFGAIIGGPIRKDKSFFFANYEGQRRAESNRFSQVILTNFNAINQMRRRFGLVPEVINQLRSNDYDQGLLKLDHKLSDAHDLSARYIHLVSNTENFLGGNGRASSASSTARNNRTRDQAFVFTITSVLSNKLVNEARFQAGVRDFNFESVLKEPALEVSNLINTGKSTSDVDFYRESRAQWIDNVSYVTGSHQVKAGLDFNHIRDKARWELFFPARIIFPSLPALLNFGPNSTSGPVNFWWPTLTDGRPHPGFRVPFTDAVPPEWSDEALFDFKHGSYGLFAQDQWRIGQKLTLTYGLRYDVESYPSLFVPNRDINNIQPRVGIAYALNNKGAIRVGYGVFHDRLAASVGQVFTTIAWSSRGYLPNAKRLFPDVADITGRFRQLSVVGPAATPAAINFLTTGRPPATGNLSLTDGITANLKTPYSQQASLQISQEVGWGVALTGSYLFLRADDLLAHTPNLNAFQTGTLPTGKPIIAGRRYPEVGNFYVVDNVGYSIYHGGTLEFEKRFSKGIGFHGSHTWSKTITNVDSVTNLADFPENLDLRLERAISRQHVGQRFTLGLITQVPSSVPVVRDIKVSSLVSLESGRRFNVFSGADSNGDGNPLSDRPGLLGRNTLRGPMYASVDLRVARLFKLGERVSSEFTVDFFNVLNRVNIKDLNTVYGSFDLRVPPVPSFNTPRDVFNPRQIQFGLKLNF